MDKYIEKIVRENGLPENSAFLLDSIAFQLGERSADYQTSGNYDNEELRGQLGCVISIASRYDDKVGALKILDESIARYLCERVRYRKGITFKDLDDAEKIVQAICGRVVLNGLRERVESVLFNVKSRPLPSMIGGLFSTRDDTNPWQENAIRALEG